MLRLYSTPEIVYSTLVSTVFFDPTTPTERFSTMRSSTRYKIQHMIAGYKDSDLIKAFEGVNGHDVVDEKQLFYPGERILPHRFKERCDINGE